MRSGNPRLDCVRNGSVAKQHYKPCNKFSYYKIVVINILLYGNEKRTLLADPEKRTQAFETKCLGRFLRISY